MFAYKEGGRLSNDYPEFTAICKSSLEKSKSFEAFADCYVNNPKEVFTIVHNDSHERQCIWSVEHQSAFVFDYELVGFGHPVTDLCYFWMFLSMNIDLDYEVMLQHYHKKLTSFGDSVTSETYSYEQLHEDFGRYMVPKVMLILGMCYATQPGDHTIKAVNAVSSLVKKFGITPDNVQPMLIFL